MPGVSSSQPTQMQPCWSWQSDMTNFRASSSFRFASSGSSDALELRVPLSINDGKP